MKKLLMLIITCANTLVVNAERVKATFTIVDDWGAPVTNASLKILTPRNAYTLSWNGPIPHSEYNTKTDEKGCAICSFASPQRRFMLNVDAPGFYSERRSNLSFGKANEINVPILMRKIVKPVEMVKTELVSLPFPSSSGLFGFDLEKGDWVLPDHAGCVADLMVDYLLKEVGDKTICTAMVTFVSGGGYKMKKIPSSSFPTAYFADTNKSFNANLSFSLEYTTSNHGDRKTMHILADDEYIVYRTRVVTNDVGQVLSAHYGTFYGDLTSCRHFGYMTGLFNPTPNDINLEDDRMYKRYEDAMRREAERKKKSWDIMGLFGK